MNIIVQKKRRKTNKQTKITKKLDNWGGLNFIRKGEKEEGREGESSSIHKTTLHIYSISTKVHSTFVGSNNYESKCSERIKLEKVFSCHCSLNNTAQLLFPVFMLRQVL